MENLIYPAFVVAVGTPKKNATGKSTPQTYYTKADHVAVKDNNDLFNVITRHGVIKADDATPEQIKQIKSKLGYFIPGGLISGGSEKQITGADFGKAEFDMHTRRNGNIGPSGIAAFDIDDMSELAYQKLTGGMAALFGEGSGELEKYHGLAYETISSKPGARRLRVALFLTEAAAVEDKATIYAQIEQMLMRNIGAERCQIEKANKNGDVTFYPGWKLADGITQFDTTAARETQLMYGAPANEDWPIWLFDGARLDVSTLPELDEGAKVAARGVPNSGQWQAPESGAGELGEYLLINGLAEWHNEKTLNVLCAWEDEHSSGEPGQINNSTVLKLDANENRARFLCSHSGCHAAGHWDGPEQQARFARGLGVPEDIISRTFGSESVIHDFEDLEPLPALVVSLEDCAIETPVDIEDHEAVNPEAPREAGRFTLDNWRAVDVTTPPGFAGQLVEAIDRTAHRELKPAAVAGAFQILATAAGIGKRRGITGGKLSLITLTIAETAAGKEAAQEFVKLLFSAKNLAKHTVGQPRTDKDLILNAIQTDGATLYPIDEAHGYMTSITDGKSSEFKRALGSLMLEMATTECFILSGTHLRELQKDLDAKKKNIASLQKQLATAQAKAGDMLCEEELTLTPALDAAQREAEKIEDLLASGLKSPVANFMMSSTPAKFDAAINNEDIASGLLGRSLVFRCDEGRAKLRRDLGEKFDIDNPYYQRLADIVGNIADIKNTLEPLRMTADAEALLNDIYEYFEDDNRRNAPIVGGLYARGMERIRALASLLAMDSRIITAEMLFYSFGLFMTSTEDITSLARENAAGDINTKIQFAILAKLKKGKTAHSALLRSLTRKAQFAEAVQQAKLRGRASPFEEALKAQLDAGNICQVGKSYELAK